MGSPTPFAYGPLGEVLVATDGRWVCVSPEREQGPLWSFQAAAPVAGVRNTRAGILAVDARGVFTQLVRADGKVLGRIDCEVAATALAATPDGVWAVSHPGGVCLGRGGKLLRR